MTKNYNLSTYRGRFAPSPSGELHFGSLVAAVGSLLQAKSQSGKWLLRVEDIDPPRIVPGSIDAILFALEAHQLYWDEAPVFQSRRTERYEEILQILTENGDIFCCHCSRSRLKGLAVYPGHCREANFTNGAIRIRTDQRMIQFSDIWQGQQNWSLAEQIGDFVIRRADKIFAYQLATVIDDFDQGITEVIRGADLLDSTPRQIFLQKKLDFPTPNYGHLPVATHANGQKLSKQNFAQPLNPETPQENLVQALRFLSQHPPDLLLQESLETLWQWAIAHWNPAQVPKKSAVRVESPALWTNRTN